MSNDRIYIITETEINAPGCLVRAASQAQALRHVSRNRFEVRVATTKDMAYLMPQGIEVEYAAGTEIDE